MEDKKKYGIIGIFVVICLLLLILFYPRKEKLEENFITDHVTEEQDLAKGELKEEKVTGYHLVTYAQSANSNSFIQSITVQASNDAKIRFVIGTIDSNFVVQERTSLEKDCQKGENTFDLLKERHIIKQGEYLFMDVYGQDVLYTQKGVDVKTYVQNENTKVSGKMILTESNYILPFQYTLKKVEKYNALVIGNNITTQNGGKGLDATEEERDYYHITKTRLENTFDTININCINATSWEMPEKNKTRKEWLADNLKKDSITDLDLAIIQLGDNYELQDSSLEKDMTDFVEHLRQYSPNVEIIWVGVWKKNDEMITILPGICERLGIELVSISDLLQPDYQSLVKETIDDTVYETYYPNNEAMQMISNRIIETLKFDF